MIRESGRPSIFTNALAIAFSFGTMVNVTFLLFALRKKVAGWDDAVFFRENVLIFLATILAGIVAQISKSVFAFFAMSELDTFVKVFMQLSFGSVLGLGTFLLLCHLFRIEEYHSLRRFIVSKVLRSPEAISSVEGHPEKGEW